jgi:uncharacterized membrane protein YebE (DUF533 family)
MAPALLDRLLGRNAAPSPDAPPDQPPVAGEPDGGPEPAETALRAELAQKVLHAWAQNQQQVLVPLSLNLARLEPGPRALLVQAMATALTACRATAAPDRLRLSSALGRIGGAGEAAAAEAALDHPPNLLELVAVIERDGLGAHAYAAAALVLNQRVTVERAFLEWLAARFALPPSLTANLARHYRR